ncbi:MAG: hypothetical protein ACJ763_12060, partial [Bdellovibrionia bacterium]
VAQNTIFSSRAGAMDQDTRTLIRGGTYGLVGGTIVGAAVLPLTGSVRGVFIGSSLGLYMGLLLGVYRITHEDEGGPRPRGEIGEPQSALAFQAPKSPMEMPLSARVSFSMPLVKF